MMATADSVNSQSTNQPRNSAQPRTVAEHAVRRRYSAAAQQSEAALCCPVSYNPRYLKAIPTEILEKDYGCGDPSPFVNPGETVLDLGSGGGKLCFIASQIVGKNGKVIGIDCNWEMLDLARRHQDQVAANLGYGNVEFRCGRIQDLALNLELLADEISGRSINSVDDWLAIREIEQKIRREQPLVAHQSIDCVISNCVLNLVDPEDRAKLFSEIYRVLKVGGRAAISDIVSDEDVPADMQHDDKLWSGCISGAWREDRFIDEFRAAGFGGIRIANLEREPWQTVRGIEFRSITVLAYKLDDGPCLEQNQAVIYRGPFAAVIDDDGHQYRRGERMAVCGRTFDTLRQPPYEADFIAIEPRAEISPEGASEFDCTRDRQRDPRETKGQHFDLTILNNSSCCGGDDCC